MSCQACQEFQKTEFSSWFRWKNANVEIRACDKHLKEIFEVLRAAQEEKPKDDRQQVIENAGETRIDLGNMPWDKEDLPNI